MFYEVVPVQVFKKGKGILTYSSEEKLLPGHIVSIPLGKTSTTGIVLKKVASVSFKTRPITKLLYPTPLPAHLLKSLIWLSDYYLAPLPSVAKLLLPVGINKKRRKTAPNALSEATREPLHPSSAKPSSHPTFPLNPAQKQALEALQSPLEGTKLLHGVTGSGKTNIYLKLAENALRAQKSVILLVPEIALTSQLVQVFSSVFQKQIILIHSRQTEAERHLIWQSILESREPLIIIGPRSALFAPVKNLGAIIIDEAHESAYFQENPPKYSAVRLASYMASALKIPCILGTATPLITDYYLASSKNSLISLTKKAKSTATPPEVSIIDLSQPQHFTKNRYFSDQALAAISDNLKNHRQTLIFHNRRGSSPLTLCEKCGWQALCPACFLPLTLHSDSYRLVCHTCGHAESLPHSCPDCHHPSIVHKGFGTKLLESELKKLFKTAKIARFDADNHKSDSLDQLYDEVKSGDIDIIIGTQTIARGLDLPNLASVCVVQADAGLSLPDYSAEERTFHLLAQVIGRVGRGHLEHTSVIIQTFQPDHPVIKYALASDYLSFYRYLLGKRHRQHFPPFTYLAKLSVTYKTEKTTIAKIEQILSLAKLQSNLTFSTPAPAFHERTTSGYTWQIMLRSSSRKTLTNFLGTLPDNINFHFSLDPPSLL